MLSLLHHGPLSITFSDFMSDFRQARVTDGWTDVVVLAPSSSWLANAISHQQDGRIRSQSLGKKHCTCGNSHTLLQLAKRVSNTASAQIASCQRQQLPGIRMKLKESDTHDDCMHSIVQSDEERQCTPPLSLTVSASAESCYVPQVHAPLQVRVSLRPPTS